MGKRGPRPVQDLWYWEREWCAIFEGLRDGTSSYLLEELQSRPRRLSRHPDLRRALRNELPVALRIGHRKIRGIPPERDLWKKLKQAVNVEDVQGICRQSQFWLNPRKSGKPFVETLSTKAGQFLAAKNDRRYPGSERASSEDKRLRYLARAMAGITLKRSPRTSVDLLARGMSRGVRSAVRQGYDTGTIHLPLPFDFAVIKPNGEVVPLS